MNDARESTARLADLLHRENVAMADFIVALADFDQRKLWRELGHSSLFYFLHRELGLSKGAAFYRKTAAELVQRFPEVVEPLKDGRLCITSIVHLARVLTLENRHETLPRFFHRSRREAMAVAAEIRPNAAVPHRDVVTAVRAPAAGLGNGNGRELVATESQTVQPAEPRLGQLLTPFNCTERERTVHEEAPLASGASSPRGETAVRRETDAPVFEPLTADLSRFHVTVSRRFLAKLEAARDALSHARPGATAEEILEAGLDLVLARQAKRRGLVAKPREPRDGAQPARSNRVPAHVKRAVWARDGGRCQWPIDGGGICGSTLRVELDHVVPRARGGPSTVEGNRLLCRFHNDLAARRVFGDAWMDRFTRKRAGAEGVGDGGG